MELSIFFLNQNNVISIQIQNNIAQEFDMEETKDEE